MNYVVTDLELTCWGEDQPQLRNLQYDISEIIEFGAVKLDENYNILDEFQCFVKPVRLNELSDFCINLTNISQNDVDNADDFATSFRLYNDWVGDWESSEFVSWGNDLLPIKRLCEDFKVECSIEGFTDASEEFSFWAKGFPGRFSTRGYGLNKAVVAIGLEFEGTPHRALVDSKNTAKVFSHVRAPENISLPSKIILDIIKESPVPINRGHIRKEARKSVYPALASKWYHSSKQLKKLGLVKDLGNGKGLVLNE